MSKADYNSRKKLPAPRPNARYRTRNPTVDNVRAEFGKIRVRGDYLQAWDGGKFYDMRYTANVDNDLGKNNHFQGFQRLRRNYLVISGGDPHRGHGIGPGAHLVIVKMGSRPSRGPWGSNIITRTQPTASDAVVRIVGMDRALWHAGGMNVCGDILAVPIESNRPQQSKIVFFNMAKPEEPEQFAHAIVRRGTKAGAVALTRLANDHYLAAAWSDSDKNPKKPKKLDFYLSRSTKFADGFHQAPLTWFHTDVRAARGQDKNFSDFQTINFVTQSDGRLFLIGLHNTSKAAPTVPGRDYADLYSVRLPRSMLRANPVLNAPVITKIANRRFFCNDQQCNMDGSAGVYIDEQGRLHVYSAWHWRSANLLRFNEYRSQLDTGAAKITSMADAWIDLYEHDTYRGRRLSIIGRRSARISNYGEINVQGERFDDDVSSVRYQLPRGVSYKLFKDRGFKGKALTLRGTGAVEEIKNIHRQRRFGDVSSSRFL